MENNKTQAELYREERKERLAKAAAKNAKRSPKSIKASKVAKKVISIVLAVVIALGAVAGVLNFFDIPQKAVKISIDGLNEKISLAEVNYYYFQGWSQVYSNTLQYDQYGEGMGLSMTGFDVTKTPDKQEYVEEGKNILTVTETGYGRQSSVDDYRVQSRGGKGLTNYRVSKFGDVTQIAMVDDTNDIILISSDGIVIRVAADSVSKFARPSKGVRVMKVKEGERIIAMSITDKDEQNEEIVAEEKAETAEETLTPPQTEE